jgi:hypothetical protein
VLIEGIVQIPAVDDDNGAWGERQVLRDADIVGIAIGHQGPARQTPLMIELQMQLDRALRALKPRPVEHRRAQLDDRGIQQPQGMREAKPPPLRRGQGLAAAQDVVEHRLKQLPGAMRIGIGQRGPRRTPVDPQMHEFAESRGQPAADLAQRVGGAYLAKQHRHELVPTGEPLRGMLGPMLPHRFREGRAINQG